MQELGADEVLNYKEEDFAQKYQDKPFDLVIDPIGGETLLGVCSQQQGRLPHYRYILYACMLATQPLWYQTSACYGLSIHICAAL